MTYDKTELNFLERDCGLQFGEERGAKIFRRAAKLYGELVVTTDYKNDDALKKQLKGLVYPVIAYYKTLLAEGVREPEALEYVREEVKKAAKNCAEILDAQKRRFFPFHAFKRNIKKFMASKFPSADWKCSPPKARIGKVSFRVKECLYYKISKKFGCPELCFIFCEYEEEAFKGLAPAIGSRREGALATGHEACAFTFFKGRKA